jgi:WhiB family redox-sensing transcriptional regulator
MTSMFQVLRPTGPSSESDLHPPSPPPTTRPRHHQPPALATTNHPPSPPPTTRPRHHPQHARDAGVKAARVTHTATCGVPWSRLHLLRRAGGLTHIALQTRVQRQNELLGDLPVTILASSITLGAAETDWRDDALCRETDPELFFPVGTTGNALVQIDNAKEVCGECPSAQGCLDFALDTNQDSGIWGGLTEEERRVIRRKRVAATRAARAAVG